MNRGMFLIAGVFILAVTAAPALAQGSVKIPEPTDMILFGLAVAGLIVGRQSSRIRPRDDDNDA